MASDYTDLILEAYDAFNWGDWQWVLDNMHPEFEWVADFEVWNERDVHWQATRLRAIEAAAARLAA